MSYIALASLLLSSAAALTVGEGYVVRFPKNQDDAKPEFLFAKRYGQTNVVWYGHFQVPGHLAINGLRMVPSSRYDSSTYFVWSRSTTPVDFKVQGKLTIKGSSYLGTYHDCELTGKIEGIQLRGIRLRRSVRFRFVEFSRGIIKSPNLQCQSSNATVRNYIMNTGNKLLTNLHFQNSGVALPLFILEKAESIFIHQHLQQHFFARKLLTFTLFNLTILSVDGIYSRVVHKMSVSTTDENPETVSVTGGLKYTTRLLIRVAGKAQWYDRSLDVKGSAILLNAFATVIAEHKKTFYSSLRSEAVIKPRSFIIRGELDRSSVHFYCKHEGTRLLVESFFVSILKREGIAFTDTS